MIRDNAQAYIDETEIKEICTKLAAQIENDYRGKSLVVICVLKGSLVFTADLIRQINLPMKIEFVRLSSYGGKTESSGVVQIVKDISIPLEGQHALIIEDILDTGQTLHFFYSHVLAKRPESLKKMSSNFIKLKKSQSPA
jgi:hypoxanthine phosphoribosyltransferase